MFNCKSPTLHSWAGLSFNYPSLGIALPPRPHCDQPGPREPGDSALMDNSVRWVQMLTSRWGLALLVAEDKDKINVVFVENEISINSRSPQQSTLPKSYLTKVVSGGSWPHSLAASGAMSATLLSQDDTTSTRAGNEGPQWLSHLRIY